MSAAETRGSCTATTRPTSAISGHEVKTFLDHHMSMPSGNPEISFISLLSWKRFKVATISKYLNSYVLFMDNGAKNANLTDFLYKSIYVCTETIATKTEEVNRASEKHKIFMRLIQYLGFLLLALAGTVHALLRQDAWFQFLYLQSCITLPPHQHLW